MLADGKKRLVIVGAGSLAMELVSWMIESKKFEEISNRLFFIDDKVNEDINIDSYQVTYLGKIKDYKPETCDDFYLAIANPEQKSSVVKVLEDKNAVFKKFIHPSVIIAPNAKIGKGCILFPYSICSFNSNLKEFITINLHSVVGHDVFVDSFSTLSSFVDLTGKVKVGKKVMIGTGAKFLPEVQIGDSALIGAGSVILRSIPKNKTTYCFQTKIL